MVILRRSSAPRGVAPPGVAPQLQTISAGTSHFPVRKHAYRYSRRFTWLCVFTSPRKNVNTAAIFSFTGAVFVGLRIVLHEAVTPHSLLCVKGPPGAPRPTVSPRCACLSSSRFDDHNLESHSSCLPGRHGGPYYISGQLAILL